MKLGWQPRKWIAKKAKLGARAYPIGTIAFYGPDDRRATKVAAAIIPSEGEDASDLRRWFSGGTDVRSDDAVFAEIAAFLREGGARSITMPEGLLGCPHEEGVDYPAGEDCPHCPYWAGRDRGAALTGSDG